MLDDLLAIEIELDVQPRSAMRLASGSTMSQVTTAFGPPSENLMPRMPPSLRLFNSASATAGWTTATPRALAPSCATASIVTRLSVA